MTLRVSRSECMWGLYQWVGCTGAHPSNILAHFVTGLLTLPTNFIKTVQRIHPELFAVTV